jgi:hypothetical protein
MARPGTANVRQAVMAARLEVDLAREAAHAGDAARAAKWADKCWESLTEALPALPGFDTEAPAD